MPRPTFEGLLLPYETMSLGSRARTVIHRYLRKPAGPSEDHGRDNYKFTFDCQFHDDARYSPPLFPDTVNALRTHYNKRTVGILVLPHIGRVRVKIDEWDETYKGDIVSGGAARIGFTEQDDGFLSVTNTRVDATSLQSQAADFQAKVDELDPDDRVDIFDAINSVAGEIFAVRDAILLHGELAQSKVTNLINLIREADRTVALFQSPDNWELLYSMKYLLIAAQDLLTRPGNETGAPAYYTVERTSTITEVATIIYGTPDRSADLLSLNVFPDAMAITAGTKVLYLRPSTKVL